MRKHIGTMFLILSFILVGLVGAQGDQDPTATPPPSVTISSPAPGAVLPNMNAITVTGTGTSLFENSLTVQALDSGGNILAQQPVTTNAPEVGGTGSYQATLSVSVAPGTAGVIRAFAVSANDGSIVAESTINVTYGSTPAPSSITINTPTAGSVLPNNGTFLVSGTATNVFEGNVVVQARDGAGNVLTQQPTTAPGAALGGTGNWQINLTVNVAAGTNGSIRAFSESPQDGSVVAEAIVNVTYGAIPDDADLTITFPAAGTVVNTAGGVTVNGTSRNITDGNVTVQLRDGNNRVLSERSVKTSPTQGDGQWTAQLGAFFTANIPGSIYAFAPGVGEGGQFVSDTIFVTFQTNCGVRTDWPVYIVQRGDTLTRIAQRVSSSVSELAQANCLNNPSIIEVGQQLRVPRQPINPTPPPVPSIISITAPQNGAAVNPASPIIVTGTGSGLSNVTVQALDASNNVLAAQTVVVSAGRWQAMLSVGTATGTSGRITAFATSPQDGSVIASASVSVFFGQQPPSGSMLEITTPQPFAVLNTQVPSTISGTGSGLSNASLVVRVLDNDSNVLGDYPVTLNDSGNWLVNVTIDVAPGTWGMIYAYAQSPSTGSIVAADLVNVIFGADQPGPFVTISEPMPYSTVGTESITVRGYGGRLFEGNVVVRALDNDGNTLSEGPTIINASEMGGEGEWEISLSLGVVPGTRGIIEAFSTSPEDGSVITHAQVPVIYGEPVAGEPFIQIANPLPGSPISDATGLAVMGYASALPSDIITVQLIDDEGNILASRSANIGGDTWEVMLTLVSLEPGTSGRLVAFASGSNGAGIARDSFDVRFIGDVVLR